jgi:hypothetical protein
MVEVSALTGVERIILLVGSEERPYILNPKSSLSLSISRCSSHCSKLNPEPYTQHP